MLSEPAGRPIRSAKFFLSGGGTGGHVYPALAVAVALRERAARAQEPEASAASAQLSAVYVGSQDGMEAGLVAGESDLPFRDLPAAALRGRSPVRIARNAATLARGTRAARRLIAADRPMAILGTGGYVCVPLFLAAWSAGVPTAIYLPDVVPGLAVRFLARLATVVACNIDDSAEYFRFSASQSKIVVTGYPIRRELFAQDRATCRAAFGLAAQPPVVFVYGGSRGARSINRAIAALLPHLLPIAQLIHVCGREGDETWLRAAAEQLPGELRARYRLYPYLFGGNQGGKVASREPENTSRATNLQSPTPSMVQAFGAADLAICRSGASTLGELPAAGLPAILVPYPFVHQEANADYLVQHGAAIKVRDGEMLGEGRPEAGQLFQALQRLIGDARERAKMSEQSKALAQPDAAERLADLVLALAINKRITP